MINDLIFTISKDKHTDEAVRSILTNHPEIKFVSLMYLLNRSDTLNKKKLLNYPKC